MSARFTASTTSASTITLVRPNCGPNASPAGIVKNDIGTATAGSTAIATKKVTGPTPRISAMPRSTSVEPSAPRKTSTAPTTSTPPPIASFTTGSFFFSTGLPAGDDDIRRACATPRATVKNSPKPLHPPRRTVPGLPAFPAPALIADR